MTFSKLGLSDATLCTISEVGYLEPTPIQAKVIPEILAKNDVLGCAQTGTGKTASFILPMIDRLTMGRSKARMPRALVLEPTRELAIQVAENADALGKHTKLKSALLIGGQSMAAQEKILKDEVDILIQGLSVEQDIYTVDRMGLITPASPPFASGYDAASQAEQNLYAFIGASGTNQVGASGDPGYIIIPD